MPAFLIADSTERTCRFVGQRIVDVHCEVLEFPDQHLWFELSGFLAEDHSWVVVIVIKRCGAGLEDIVRYYRSASIDDIEDFLLDFDPAPSLPLSNAVYSRYECAAEQLMTHLHGFASGYRTARSRVSSGIWQRLLNLIARIRRSNLR
ncbi:hypothetical protein [Stieleria magnilauensis]